MTDLTEQLKKGELIEGWYYVKKVNGQEDIAECYKVTDVMTNVSHTIFEFSEDIEQVLVPVPSYEKLQAKLEENDKLKELLKECELWFVGVVNNINDINVGKHNRNLPIGNFEHTFKVFSQKINKVLGDDK